MAPRADRDGAAFQRHAGRDVAHSIDDGRDLNGGGLVIEELPACDQYTIQGDLFSRAILEGGEPPVPLEDAVETWR